MALSRENSFSVMDKDPNVAMALSVVPGVGQFYNGESRKGFLFFLVTLVNCFALLLWITRASILTCCDSLARTMHVSLNQELENSLLAVGPNSPVVYAVGLMLLFFTAFSMRDAFTKANFRRLQSIYASSSLAISEATAGSYLVHLSLLLLVLFFVIFFCKPAKLKPQYTEFTFVEAQEAPVSKKVLQKKSLSQKAVEASGKHNPQEKIAPSARGATSATRSQGATPRPVASAPRALSQPAPVAPSPRQLPVPQPTPHPAPAPTLQPAPAPHPMPQPSSAAPATRPSVSTPPSAPNPVPQPSLKSFDSASKISNNPVPLPMQPNNNLLASLPPAAAHHSASSSLGLPGAPGPVRDTSTSSSSASGGPTPIPSSSHSSSNPGGAPGASGIPQAKGIEGGHPGRSGFATPAVAPSAAPGDNGAAREGHGNAPANANANAPKVVDGSDKEIDFTAFMADLQRRIKKAWYPPKAPQSANCQVVFKVHLNGELSGLRIAKSSGMAAYDNAALKAVENAAPFRSLPAGAKDDVDVQFTFDYNVFSGSGGAFRRF